MAEVTLTTDGSVALATIVAVMVALYTDLASVTSVMFASTLFLTVTGVITTADFIAGLHTTSIISIGHLFIVASPFSELRHVRGLVSWAIRGDICWLSRLRLCAATLLISMFANQNPTVVLLTPLVKQRCQELGISASKYLLPMAYASALGGSLTLVGTSVNLTYNGLLENAGFEGMGFFDLMHVTLVPSIMGLAYLTVVPEWMIEERGGLAAVFHETVQSCISLVVVQPHSDLVLRRVVDAVAPNGPFHPVVISDVRRKTGECVSVSLSDNDVLLEGDQLTLIGPHDMVAHFTAQHGVEWAPKLWCQEAPRSTAAAEELLFDDADAEIKTAAEVYDGADGDRHTSVTDSSIAVRTNSVSIPPRQTSSQSSSDENIPQMMEVVVSYRCTAVNETVGSGAFLRQYGLPIIALRKCRGAQDFTMESRLLDCIIETGDTLLVFGPPSRLVPFSSDFALVTRQSASSDASSSRRVADQSVTLPCISKRLMLPPWHKNLAYLIAAGMIAFTICRVDIFLTSAVAVALTVGLKLLSLREALHCVDLHVMLSIVYSFGLGIAMTRSGLAASIGESIARASLGETGLLLLVAAIGTIVTNAITNKACAQVLFPVVVSTYRQLGRDPMPAVFVLCAVSSWAFMTPYGKPTNLIIMGPGGYKAKDYLWFGAPLNVALCFAVALSASLV